MNAQTVPNQPGNPPAARAHNNQFSLKSCKSPGNTLHCSLQPPFAPAALPQLDSLRPMKTVCPSYQPTPNHAARTAALHARPCRIRPLSAFHKEPYFRTSQIVSDRLGSSRIVRAHRPPFPRNCRNVRPIPPANQAKKHAMSRPDPPANARKKESLSGVFGSRCHFQLLATKCRNLQLSCLQLCFCSHDA